MPEPKIANIVDVEVGQRIKHRRKHLGLSQTALADKIGVTFQQVQKYEKGTNRVGSSRLHRIALALGMNPSALFGETATADEASTAPGDKTLMEFAASVESLHLNSAFLKIDSISVRRSIVGLVKALAAGEDKVVKENSSE